MRLFSTEQVSKYHPDKYADQISDAILTACLRQDKDSHCGIETMVKDNTVVLGGEITTKAKIDVEQIVKQVAAKLGYTVDKVINLIGQQSPQINNAVSSVEEIGAGDQGTMFGYATAETSSRLPFGPVRDHRCGKGNRRKSQGSRGSRSMYRYPCGAYPLLCRLTK